MSFGDGREYNRSFTEVASDGVAWYFRLIAPNRFEVYLDPKVVSDQAFNMTGADITKKLKIPFAHRLNSILFYHVTSAYVASYYYTKFVLKRNALTTTSRRLQEVLESHTRINMDTAQFQYGEAFERPEGEYEFTLNSLTTEKIMLIIYLQKLV